MPSNDAARAAAVRHGAVVLPFVQGEGNCDGLVSWWMRSRLQGKEIWREKYFDRIYDAAKHPVEGEGRHIASDHYHPTTGVLERTDKGLAKARVLQAQFYNTTADRAYITKGIRSDKPDKAEKEVAEYAGAEISTSISDFSAVKDNANNIIASFIRASLNRYVCKYTVASTTGHALGLDCLASPAIRYFDPNIGEFRFSCVADLISWWRECYQSRRTGGGAFGIMLETFKAERYRPA